MKRNRKEFFDDLALKWDDITRHDASKLKHIVSLLRLKPGDTVLDVGSGTGITLPYLFHYVQDKGRIIAVDISPKMLDLARRKLEEDGIHNVEFRAEDVNHLTMDRQYDAILCYSCFPHFDDQFTTVSHLAGGLKPGGLILIAHSESRKAINMHHNNAGPAVRTDYLPPPEDIATMLKNGGLKVTYTEDSDEIFLILAEPE